MRLAVRAWPTPDALLAHLGAVDEVAGCVIHGLAHTWLNRPESFRPGTPLLTVEADGKVAAAAVQASQGKIVFSLGPAEAILALAAWCDEAGRRPTAMIAPESALPILLSRWPGRRTLETTLYRLDQPPAIPKIAGHLRPATKAEIAVFTDWVATFTVEAHLPPDPKPRTLVEAKIAAGHLFVWEVSGVPVAIAALAGPTPRSVRLNTVYTPPQFRKRGYGSAAVATLAAQQFGRGKKVVTLFADRALAHTNRMYARMGFQPVADFADVEIERA